MLLVAGGERALLRSVEGAEDDAKQGLRLIEQHAVTSQDVLIAVAASGTTRFTLACLREAKLRGALTLGIANNQASPILQEADHPIFLDTGSEPIAGSDPTKGGHGTEGGFEHAFHVANDPPREGASRPDGRRPSRE